MVADRRWLVIAMLGLPVGTMLASTPTNAAPPSAQTSSSAPIALEPSTDDFGFVSWDSGASVGETAAAGAPSALPSDFQGRLDSDLSLLWQDFRNFYSPLNLLEVGAGIGVAAPLANTRADENIREWYRRQVHPDRTLNSAAHVFSYGCEIWTVVPISVEGMGLAGWLDDDYAHDGGLAEWSSRAVRSMAVGTPTLLATYVLLGAGRPSAGDSSWHPFENIHGASGHTFYGAIPFLTAAEMTDNLFWQVPLFAGSFATGWARIHEDQHYASQVILGWWLAYLSCRRVDDTEAAHRSWTLTPMTSEGPGIGVQFRF